MNHFGTAYFGNTILEHFKRDLNEMRRQGIDFIIITFSETDLWHHEKAIADMVKEARRKGFKVYLDPWAVGGVFGGEAMSMLTVWHPQERQIRSDGRMAPALCINSPALITYMKKWIQAARHIKPDFILWDEPHFYLNWWDEAAGWKKSKTAWSCRCKRCCGIFKKRTGAKLPLRETPDVKEFKLRSIREFLIKVCRYSASRGLKNCISLFPNEQDWFLESLAQEPAVHMLGGESYFEYGAHRPKNVKLYAEYQTRLMERWGQKYKKKILMWVRGFRVPKGYEGDVKDSIEGCVAGGADEVATWGFKACKHVSSASSARPDRVWEVMGKTYRKLGKTKHKLRLTGHSRGGAPTCK